MQRLFSYPDGHRSERVLGAALTVLDWLWQPVRILLWVCVVLGLFLVLALGLVAALEISLPDVRTVPVAGHFVGYLLTHTGWLIIGGVALIVLAIAAWWAHGARAETRAADDPLTHYDLQKARWLEPAEFVPAYVPHQYLWRHAGVRQPDEVARMVLREAARGHRDGPLGICVLGRPAQGKTRLAWEAVQAALPGWTLVRWSHVATRAFDLDHLHSRRVLVWVDDLHEFANLAEAPTLCDLPRVFAKSRMRLVIVATCREGADEAQTRMRFAALMGRLREVRLVDISDGEANSLVADLAREGVRVHRTAFDGTPGSLVLDLAQRRTHDYAALPEGAKRALRALKLLRSAGILTSTETRTRAAAEALFGLPVDPHAWPLARTTLLSAGLIRLSHARIARARVVEPAAVAFLDQVVADFPAPGSNIADEWPRLRAHLAARSDAAGLFALGNRYRELTDGDRLANLQHAEVCYWEALRVSSRRSAPLTWTGASSNLGVTLTAEADLIDGPERLQLLEVATRAQRAALKVYRRRGIWENWVRTQTNLGLTLREAALLSEDPDRGELLRGSVRALRAAASMQTNAVTDTALLRAQTTLAAVSREEAALAEQTDRLQRLRAAVRNGRAALQAGGSQLARQAAQVTHAPWSSPSASAVTRPLPSGYDAAEEARQGISIAAETAAPSDDAAASAARRRRETLPPLIGVYRDPGQTAPIPVPDFGASPTVPPGKARRVVIGEEVRTVLEEQDVPEEGA
jgi:hypothetical protein